MADKPEQTAWNFGAPPAERRDAMSELHKAHAPTLASELLPREDIQPVIDWINRDLEQQALQKARGVVIPFPERHRKRKGGPVSVFLDDLQIFATGEYWEKPTPLGYDSLRQMVDQTPILNAIIMTRIRQIQRFTRPQETANSVGYVIRHVDKDHELTPEEEKSTKLLSRFFTHCGWEFGPRRRKRLGRDNFTTFMAKLVRDTLTMDACAIETELKRDKKFGIDGLYAVDGASIRLCSEDGYRGDDEVCAVQVIQGQIRTAYNIDQLIYEPRNPRTDVNLTGYGLGETELLVRIVTGFLNAMTYNIKGFDDNSIPKGMLHLSGNYDRNDLVAFRNYWNGMVKGINNAWTLPVMVSSDQESKASFERFGIEFNELHFSKWMTFLTSLACAIYGMDPSEINFEAFHADKSGLSGNDTGERMAAALDKGIRPLMGYFETLFSDYVVNEFSDKYVFRWAGLDPEDEAKRFEIRKLTKTINELRAEEGDDATEEFWGDAPANPQLIGAWMQERQAQQQDFGEPEGMPGGAEPGGLGGPEGMPGGAEEPEGEQPEQPAQAQRPQQEGDFGTEQRAGDFGKAFPTIYTVEV